MTVIFSFLSNKECHSRKNVKHHKNWCQMPLHGQCRLEKKTYMLPIDAIFPQNSAKLFRHYQNHTKFAHISGNNLSRPFFSLFNLDLCSTLHDLRFKSIKFFHQPYVCPKVWDSEKRFDLSHQPSVKLQLQFSMIDQIWPIHGF